MRATATILARAEDKRFQKAVDAVRNGAYHVRVTLRTDEEVRGFIRKADEEREYGCTVTNAGAFCSCPDALYRGSICKHAVVLTLHVLRNPHEQGLEPPPPVLRLVKTQKL
jgi:predicted nucleic acid-binding Zn finger protein